MNATSRIWIVMLNGVVVRPAALVAQPDGTPTAAAFPITGLTRSVPGAAIEPSVAAVDDSWSGSGSVAARTLHGPITSLLCW